MQFQDFCGDFALSCLGLNPVSLVCGNRPFDDLQVVPSLLTGRGFRLAVGLRFVSNGWRGNRIHLALQVLRFRNLSVHSARAVASSGVRYGGWAETAFSSEALIFVNASEGGQDCGVSKEFFGKLGAVVAASGPR